MKKIQRSPFHYDQQVADFPPLSKPKGTQIQHIKTTSCNRNDKRTSHSFFFQWINNEFVCHQFASNWILLQVFATTNNGWGAISLRFFLGHSTNNGWGEETAARMIIIQNQTPVFTVTFSFILECISTPDSYIPILAKQRSSKSDLALLFQASPFT